MPDRIPERLSALSDTAHDLVKEVNRLNADTNTSVTGVNKRLRRNQKILSLVAISFAVDLIVTGIGLYAIHTTSDNQKDVRQLTARLDNNQQVQRRKVLCPLYRILLDSKSEDARRVYVKGPDAYDRVFKTIEDGYNALQCSLPLPNQPITPVKP